MSQIKATVEDFRAAGFDVEQARRGVKMLESGLYFGFADVATSLAGGYFPSTGAPGPSAVQQARIVEVAKRVDASTVTGDRAPGGSTASGPKVSLDEAEYQRLLAKGDQLQKLEEENARLRAERKQLKETGTPGTGERTWDEIDEALGLGDAS